jgi:hypothetical protein
MMNTENIDFNIEALKARITVLEDFIKAKHPDFPTTPKGTSGTMTGDEHSHGDEPDVIGSIRPLEIWDFVNVRPTPSVMVKPLYQVMRRESVEIVDITDDLDGTRHDNGDLYKWYKVKDATFMNGKGGGYVREDVVTFTRDTPAPVSPINASTWPMPISGYTVTNTHHNHRQHVGIDLAAPLGTKIYSGPNEGYVMKAFHCAPCGDDPEKQMHLGTGEASYGYGLGNYVIVRYYQHPAENKGHFLFVLYAHLSRINVQEKAALPPYTVIGDVGTSGNSTGPHLHIECRYSDNPLAEFYAIRANEIDPSTIFKA